jgi:hypothetical protein
MATGLDTSLSLPSNGGKAVALCIAPLRRQDNSAMRLTQKTGVSSSIQRDM